MARPRTGKGVTDPHGGIGSERSPVPWMAHDLEAMTDEALSRHLDLAVTEVAACFREMRRRRELDRSALVSASPPAHGGASNVAALAEPAELPQLLTVKEAAALLRLSRSTVNRLVQSGEIAGLRVGDSVRISVATIQEIFKSQSKEGAGPQPEP